MSFINCEYNNIYYMHDVQTDEVRLMSKKKEATITGRFERYLKWPMVYCMILAVLTIILFFMHFVTGIISLIALGAMILVSVVSLSGAREEINESLVDYGHRYSQVQKRLLDEMDVPYAVFDVSGKLMWGNKALHALLGDEVVRKNIYHIFPELSGETVIPDNLGKNSIDIEYEQKLFRADFERFRVDDFTNKENSAAANTPEYDLVAMFLVDQTEIKTLRKENQDLRLDAGIIYVDNYDEAMNSTEDVRRSLLSALIDRKIMKYMQGHDAIITKTEKDKYTFVVSHKHMAAIQSSRFAILDEVRDINLGNEMPVTLCIGIGMNAISYQQSFIWAQNAIDLALGRGGDQAVVKSGDKISYYGGKTKQVERGTRVRSRVKAHALKQIIEGKDQVMIMGHKIGDVDSFGSAIGVYRAAKALNKPAHIVINDITTSVRPIINSFKDNPEYEPDMFVKSSEALNLINMETALVVVDVNRPTYTEEPQLFNHTKTVVVIDHHRQSSESIENPVLSYIEPYASSACEMVAEILQYVGDGVKLRPIEADAMFAGIMIDTNNFSKKTGVRTFEAAAYLKKTGADITRVHMAFRDSMEIYRARAEAVRNASSEDDMAYAICSAKGLESPTIVGAQVANELLNITGIRASFVFTKLKDTVYISARSMEGEDGMNIQLVMERMGGGGHSTIAGAQLQNVTEAEAIAKVKATIAEMKKEGAI